MSQSRPASAPVTYPSLIAGYYYVSGPLVTRATANGRAPGTVVERGRTALPAVAFLCNGPPDRSVTRPGCPGALVGLPSHDAVRRWTTRCA